MEQGPLIRQGAASSMYYVTFGKISGRFLKEDLKKENAIRFLEAKTGDLSGKLYSEEIRSQRLLQKKVTDLTRKLFISNKTEESLRITSFLEGGGEVKVRV